MIKRILKSEQMSSAFYAAISIFAFLCLWELSVVYTRVGNLMPSPIEVLVHFFKSFIEPIGKLTMPWHILWSLWRVVPFYIIGSIVGIALGISMGWYKSMEAIFRPLFEVLRPIPAIAWIPISIIWFGIGEGSKWFLIFISSFVATTINAYAGAKNVDQTLVGCSKMLGANEWQVFSTVVLPSSIPYIFAGLQIGLASAWATVVAAEMIRSTEGVGWIIISSQETNNTVQTLVGIVAIGIVGFILAIIMRGIEDKLCRWNKREI